jgi:AcrR family transcriptional regulator
MTKSTGEDLHGRALETDKTSTADAHRQQVLRAVIDVTSEHGYAGSTVSQITQAAGVPRAGFYDLFEDKQDAFIAVLQQTSCHTLKVVQMASASSTSWTEGVCLGLQELLEFFAKEPALARLTFIEAQVAGPHVMSEVQKCLRGHVNCLAPPSSELEGPLDLPGTVTDQVLGAIYFAIYNTVAVDGSGRLPDLLPELVEIALTPYIGPQRAAAALRAHHDQRRSQATRG